MNGENGGFDRELRGHLLAELEPQHGRAAAAFEAVARRRTWHRLAIVGTSGLIAASVAVGWVMFRLARPGSATPVVAENVTPRAMEQLVSWEASDEGVEVLDQKVPVRKLRQDGIQQVQWFDPQHKAVIRMTVPVTRVILVKEDIY